MKKFIWIDIETGGFNDDFIELPSEKMITHNGVTISTLKGSQYYPILEIAAVITDQDMKILDKTNMVISHSEDVLSKMDSWCVAEHTKTGLVAECLESKMTLDDAHHQIFNFMRAHGVKKSPICGNSIHFDVDFLNSQMSKMMHDLKKNGMISHRVIDVSSFMELLGDDNPPMMKRLNEIRTGVTHRAMEDIHVSIECASFLKIDLLSLEEG